MPTVFGYHDVQDKYHWLASPKREEFFGPLGVTNIRTFVDPENPTRVGVPTTRHRLGKSPGDHVSPTRRSRDCRTLAHAAGLSPGCSLVRQAACCCRGVTVGTSWSRFSRPALLPS